MPFVLDAMTEHKVLDVGVLAQKGQEEADDPPGVQLTLQATIAADLLTQFDPLLRGMLYRRQTTAQTDLHGMEAVELTSIGQHVKRLKWEYEQTGSDVAIDYGLGGKRNIDLAAIAATLEAMRAIERHGGAQILERAFTGFAALPAPAEDWRQALGLPPDSMPAFDQVRDAYRRARSPAHAAGSEALERVQRAYRTACELHGWTP